METETIRLLNKLTTDFYEQVAASFNQTRLAPWEGWKKLLPTLSEVFSRSTPATVIDIGSGNGRFLSFLQKQLPQAKYTYTGLEHSDALREIAEQSISAEHDEVRFKKYDLIAALLSSTLQFSSTPDLVTIFGVLHHIPSFALRQRFFELLADAVAEKGIVIVSSWQFGAEKRFTLKVAAPPEAISQEQLEENDYFLGWKAHPTAVRYCHFSPLSELEKLIDATQWRTKNYFYADGKSGKLNLYLVLEKRTQ